MRWEGRQQDSTSTVAVRGAISAIKTATPTTTSMASATRTGSAKERTRGEEVGEGEQEEREALEDRLDDRTSSAINSGKAHYSTVLIKGP